MTELAPQHTTLEAQLQHFTSNVEPILQQMMHDRYSYLGYQPDMALTLPVCEETTEWLQKALVQIGVETDKHRVPVPGSPDATHCYLTTFDETLNQSLIIDPSYTQFLAGNYNLPWIAAPTAVFSVDERLPTSKMLVCPDSLLPNQVAELCDFLQSVFDEKQSVIQNDIRATFEKERYQFPIRAHSAPDYLDMLCFFTELYAPQYRSAK